MIKKGIYYGVDLFIKGIYYYYTVVGADGAAAYVGQCLCIQFWAWSYHRPTRLLIWNQLGVDKSHDKLEPNENELGNGNSEGTWNPRPSLTTSNLNFSRGATLAPSPGLEEAEGSDLGGALDPGAAPH